MKLAFRFMKGLCFLIGIIVLLFFPILVTIDAQYLDISQLTAERFPITVENKTFIVYYGYTGGFETEIIDVKKPKIQSLAIDSERRSLIIEIGDVLEPDFMWIRIPAELISAEQNSFQIFINDVKQEYDLVSYESDVRVGFLIDEDAREIEIVGTRVIPEFGSIVILLGGGILLSMFLNGKYNKLF